MTTTDEIMRLADQISEASTDDDEARAALRVAVSALVAERDAMREELDITDKLLSEKARVLQRIPACPSHGDQCVPHAIDWIDAALKGKT